MKTSYLYTSSVLCGALALGCVIDNNNNDTQSSTSSTSSTASTTSGNQSGSVTSAPGSATDETVGDSAPTMATAATTGSATAMDSGSTSEACLFLSCEDTGESPIECDNWAQDCPEGQKCIPSTSDGGSAWDATKCVEVTGTDKPGELCTSEGAASGIDSCIEGAMCWNINMDGVGTCLALCTGSFEAPVCEGICPIFSEGTLNLCLPPCDPLLQDCPNPADVCYPIYDGFTCIPGDGGDEGQANDACFINVCDEGLMCGDAAFVGMGCPMDSTGCCTPFCKFPGGLCPNPDQECVQYFDPAMFPENDPLLDIGVCGVPG